MLMLMLLLLLPILLLLRHVLAILLWSRLLHVLRIIKVVCSRVSSMTSM